MFQKYLKKLLIPAAIAGGLLMGGAAHAEDMTKDQLNQAIHDYIMDNPQVIMDSVDKYQKKDISDKQAQALQMNHEELFHNEKSPFIGNPKGDVTIIEFFDYNCHFCKDIFPVLKSLADEDKNLKIIFKDFPILGPTSETSAKWALAAQRQDKYFDFHQKMMSHKGPFTDSDVEKAAKDIGLDMSAAHSYVDGTEAMMQIERNRALASQMSFNGTPSFVINDEAFSGVPDKDELKTKIAEKRKALTSGGADDKDDLKNDLKDDLKDDSKGDKKDE